ncbi:hypothetical protein BDR06DRAFT_951332 [Suillus hirtellus]|nr:hypothetical protein BDR06DRAFT_951332 [Suillus hirtellus]
MKTSVVSFAALGLLCRLMTEGVLLAPMSSYDHYHSPPNLFYILPPPTLDTPSLTSMSPGNRISPGEPAPVPPPSSVILALALTLTNGNNDLDKLFIVHFGLFD